MNRVLHFTVWYDDKDPIRREELATCLRRTVESWEVDMVHILASDPAPFAHEKLIVKPFHGRPTYSDLFEFANLASTNGDVVIISNTDIYPGEGVRKYVESIDEAECYALSRWDEHSFGSFVHFNRRDTQDTWIFRSPIAEIEGNFPPGKPGCDNRIAYEIQKTGYSLFNPSKDIKMIHLHLSGVRNYKRGDAIPKPYAFIHPHHMNERPRRETSE